MKYRIEKDGLHWAVAKVRIPQKGKQKGQEIWTQFKWLRTIEQAAKCLQELLIAEQLGDVPELTDIIDAVKVADREVKEHLKELLS